MEKPELIYIYDAYCGWCFGFSPVMLKLQEENKGKLNVSVLSGGMVTGEQVGPLGEKREYIKQAYPKVEEFTGVKFGESFQELLERDDQINNSLQPAIALAAVRDMKSSVALEFAHSIQSARFKYAKDLTKMSTYTELLPNFGIDESSFILKYKDEKYERRAQEEFQLVQQWGITGFPTLLYRQGDEARVLTQGYQAFEPLQEMIETLRVQTATT